MKFKMKLVSFSPEEFTREVGGAIAHEQKTTNDTIPPAYPILNEKLLFIGIDSKGRSFPTALINFCRDLDATRTKHVALFVASKGDNAPDISEITQLLTKNGITVLDDVLNLKTKRRLCPCFLVWVYHLRTDHP